MNLPEGIILRRVKGQSGVYDVYTVGNHGFLGRAVAHVKSFSMDQNLSDGTHLWFAGGSLSHPWRDIEISISLISDFTYDAMDGDVDSNELEEVIESGNISREFVENFFNL